MKHQHSVFLHEPASAGVGSLGLVPAGDLNPIHELDEFNNLYSLNHHTSDSNGHDVEFRDPAELMDTVTG